MYCQKCGKEITNESQFCSSCGAPTTNTNAPQFNTYQKTMLSKEDFLSLSTEFEKEKKDLLKKQNKKSIIGILLAVIGALGTVATPFLAFVLGGFCWVFFILLFGGAIYAAVAGAGYKSKAEQLGDEHYRKYVAEFNNKNC